MDLKLRKSYKKGLSLLLLVVSGIYFYLQAQTIYGGDAGDLASAIIVLGVAHPPGYPLYTLLGILVTKIFSFGTFAWRIGFLSSLPAVLTLIILFDLIFFLTKKVSVALFSSLTLAFVYPFWLYSEVVEVFSLNNLFTVSLLWLLFHWAFEGKEKYLYLAALVFGLSLSHHHIILFMVPCLLYLFLKKRRNFTRKLIAGCFIFFLLGLTPYLYVLAVASQNSSPVNWMGSLTFPNLIALVTRARYGTFQSGGFTMQDPVLRLLNVWAFFDFAYRDFRLPGVLLAILGIFHLLKKQKTVFISLLLGFFAYLFFLYLASFPLVDNFMVATFERFILPLYLLLTIFIAYGLLMLWQKFSRFRALKLVLAILFVYPLGLFILNYPKISIIKKDFTAEKFGRDILSSIPKNSILVISTDTPLFDTQYVYYSEKQWQDVKFIHLTALFVPDDLIRLKKVYPDMELPGPDEKYEQILKVFLKSNYQKFPIFSKLVLETSAGNWIPYGLVFRFVQSGDTFPTDESVLSENKKLWDFYHVPTTGSLSSYQNLMLSDVLPNYAVAHQEIGFWAAKRKYFAVAEEHLLTAENLYPKDLDSYTILAQVYIETNRCGEAENQIKKVEERNSDDVRIFLLQAINYADCFKDKEKALYYQKLYEEKRNKEAESMKKL